MFIRALLVASIAVLAAACLPCDSDTSTAGGGGTMSQSSVSSGGADSGGSSATSTGGTGGIGGTGGSVCAPTPAFENSPSICFLPDPACCNLAGVDLDAHCAAMSDNGDLPVAYMCGAVPVITPSEGTDDRRCKEMKNTAFSCDWLEIGHVICCEP